MIEIQIIQTFFKEYSKQKTSRSLHLISSLVSFQNIGPIMNILEKSPQLYTAF